MKGPLSLESREWTNWTTEEHSGGNNGRRGVELYIQEAMGVEGEALEIFE